MRIVHRGDDESDASPKESDANMDCMETETRASSARGKVAEEKHHGARAIVPRQESMDDSDRHAEMLTRPLTTAVPVAVCRLSRLTRRMAKGQRGDVFRDCADVRPCDMFITPHAHTFLLHFLAPLQRAP